MLRVVALRYLKVPIAVALVLLLVLFALGAMIDWRWGFTALLLIFVVFPMLLMWVYVRYCLTRDIAMNTVEHTAEISPGNIRVRWRPSLLSGERDADEEPESKNDDRVPVALQWRDDDISMTRITGITYGLKAMTVWLSDCGQGAGFLYIPYSTIPEGRADDVVEMFREYIL